MAISDTPPTPLEGDCDVPGPAIPAEGLSRYMLDHDPASEADIARYVEIEAYPEEVKHVELVKSEVILGDKHDVWDVITDANRWWVITNLTNLYSPQVPMAALGLGLAMRSMRTITS